MKQRCDDVYSRCDTLPQLDRHSYGQTGNGMPYYYRSVGALMRDKTERS